MKAIQSTAAWWMLCLVGTVGTAAEEPQPTDARSAELARLGKQFVEQMRRGEFENGVAGFDATMSRVMPKEKLKAAWDSVVERAGPFEELAGVRLDKADQYDMAIVACRFKNGAVDIKVVFDEEERISGLWFSPGKPAVEYKPPPYADQGAFTEREVTIGSDPWSLPGTLTVPKGGGRSPGVVLVHGSGPNDRDEMIGPNRPFRDLAWGLATRGIGVLRYEKRTKEHGVRLAFTGARITVKEETVEDALAAAALLREAEEIDARRVFILGHSLGGMLAPRIGKRDEKIAGLIVLAGNTRPLEDIYLEQVSYILGLDGDISEDERKQIEAIEKQVARVKSAELSESTHVADLPLGVPAAYWLDLREYDPVGVARELGHPMLILQAERDYQVTMECFEGWQTGLKDKENVRMKVYPALNHLFVVGEGQSTPDEYSAGGNVAEEVVADIAEWIEGR